MRCAEKVAAAYELGQRDAIDAARKAVAALPDLVDAGFTYSGLLHRASAIAAIDALRTEKP